MKNLNESFNSSSDILHRWSCTEEFPSLRPFWMNLWVSNCLAVVLSFGSFWSMLIKQSFNSSEILTESSGNWILSHLAYSWFEILSRSSIMLCMFFGMNG